MERHYALVKDHADLSLQHAEQWKQDHEEATVAHDLNFHFKCARKLVGTVAEIDAYSPVKCHKGSEYRKTALDSLAALLELIRRGSEAVGINDYDYELTVRRVEQLQDIVLFMMEGELVIDKDAEKEALQALESGDVLDLEQFERTLCSQGPSSSH